MHIRDNENGSILLVVLIVMAIIGYLLVNGYIEETKKAQQTKQEAEESVREIQNNLENSIKKQLDESLKEKAGEFIESE
ncbi:MAG: hypothetical protein PHI66_01965 [Candidatus Pacebacteria bacterium]|nr:hypothetical protein [Candidatus Paceibacterota bacterium]